MSEPAYDAADNSKRGYDLAIKAAREACIRRGQIAPDRSRPEELRWAEEGFHGFDKLEAAANG